jgi:DNA-binding transcriptional ArsR family regulator
MSVHPLCALTDICLIWNTASVTVFEALAEPHRRSILDLLREGERPVGEIVDHLGLSQPAVSKHLRVLRCAGLVDARVDAQRRVYRTRSEGLREVDEWLMPFRAMWSSHLDQLERHLDQMASDDQEDDAHAGR